MTKVCSSACTKTEQRKRPRELHLLDLPALLVEEKNPNPHAFLHFSCDTLKLETCVLSSDSFLQEKS